jgi:hypothetical protein
MASERIIILQFLGNLSLSSVNITHVGWGLGMKISKTAEVPQNWISHPSIHPH